MGNTKFQPRVMGLTNEEIETLREARAIWGHKKYGDRDIYRDGALDMLEETCDIVNILERRMKWIEEGGISNTTINSVSRDIKQLVMEINMKIQKFDNVIRFNGYQVDDSNGGERIGLDYLDYCKTATQAHKELE